MVILESLALAEGLKGMFLYNRDLYMFDKDLNQARIMQIQKMRTVAAQQYRSDIRDLFGLTVGKMNNYLVTNTLMLAFCMGFFYEGKLPTSMPAWISWLYVCSLGSAIVFFVLAVLFAIHASITAQTLKVRLLTQWLRVPIPDDKSIPTANASGFEKAGGSAMLRLPFISKQKLRDVKSSGAVEDAPFMVNPYLRKLFTNNYHDFVDHFHMFRQLQEEYAGYDAYARVCMVIGVLHLTNVISYFGQAWYGIAMEEKAGWVPTVLMVALSTIHIRMNILLSPRERIFVSVLGGAAPILGLLIAYLEYNGYTMAALATVLPCFLLHMFWNWTLASLALEPVGQLPTRFATVVSIDVLGLWNASTVATHAEVRREDTERRRSSDQTPRMSRQQSMADDSRAHARSPKSRGVSMASLSPRLSALSPRSRGSISPKPSGVGLSAKDKKEASSPLAALSDYLSSPFREKSLTDRVKSFESEAPDEEDNFDGVPLEDKKSRSRQRRATELLMQPVKGLILLYESAVDQSNKAARALLTLTQRETPIADTVRRNPDLSAAEARRRKRILSDETSREMTSQPDFVLGDTRMSTMPWVAFKHVMLLVTLLWTGSFILSCIDLGAIVITDHRLFS